MFGAIIFIPLFLQLVYGVSPTSSGLRMLPLMAGLLGASVVSGRVISRIGRYKAFPIAGTAITTVGMFLLSRLERRHAAMGGVAVHARRRHRHRSGDAGAGLVVQNARRREDVGVATSTATFFRSMGGSLGVAVFGAIFASRLTTELTALPAGAASRLSGGVNIKPAQVHALPAAIRHEYLVAFVNSLRPSSCSAPYSQRLPLR